MNVVCSFYHEKTLKSSVSKIVIELIHLYKNPHLGMVSAQTAFVYAARGNHFLYVWNLTAVCKKDIVAIDQFGSEDVKQSVSKWIVCIPNGVRACVCVCTAGALRVLSWNYTLQSKTLQIDISSHTATIKRIGDCSDRFFLAFEFWEALDSNI